MVARRVTNTECYFRNFSPGKSGKKTRNSIYLCGVCGGCKRHSVKINCDCDCECTPWFPVVVFKGMGTKRFRFAFRLLKSTSTRCGYCASRRYTHTFTRITTNRILDGHLFNPRPGRPGLSLVIVNLLAMRENAAHAVNNALVGGLHYSELHLHFITVHIHAPPMSR